MTKITPEDLVRYIYNETSAAKAERIRVALQTDWNLRESFENLVISEQNLDNIKLSSPRVETVNKILEYASKKRVPVT
jgi:DNA-binding Xre family transcriptional regulator